MTRERLLVSVNSTGYCSSIYRHGGTNCLSVPRRVGGVGEEYSMAKKKRRKAPWAGAPSSPRVTVQDVHGASHGALVGPAPASRVEAQGKCTSAVFASSVLGRVGVRGSRRSPKP